MDPFLLAAFLPRSGVSRVVELGSGSGVISMLLARKTPAKVIVGLEVQEELVARSRQSVALNGLQGTIEIMQADIRDLPKELPAGSFDVVVTNPPYRAASSGRLAHGDERARARHELAGGLVDFLRAANVLLKSGGRFFVVYLAERLPELMAEMRCFRLEPKRLRMVHSRQGDAARLVLVEGRKNGRPGLKVEAPLLIYRGRGRDYSEEVLAIYREAGAEHG